MDRVAVRAAIDAAFRAIKHELDPTNLFSPGRIVDPPKMDDGALFRFPPATAPVPYRTIALVPALDWSAWNVQNDPLTEVVSSPGSGGDSTGGFAKAAEMCNNNGHCRKFDLGTMCPSFRVTRDEQHSTRGRANTLRLALSGQLGEGAFTGDAMREAMDLCVSCKGCKRECPTGVDMARMKIEFLAHDKQRHGWTLKDRLIAALPVYGHALARIAPLANLRRPNGRLARLGERMLGIAAARSLPKWRAATFWRTRDEALFASAEETLAAARAGGKAALLFVDTFNGLFESENAHAAAHVLWAAGYKVHTLDRARGHFCCGRTSLASGRVDEAKARIGALIDALLPFAEAGVAVVGLEPSCLLTLRDEALAMQLGDKAVTVSKQALLFEEFVAREAKAGRFDVAFTAVDAPILVHGHCHQKAFGAVDVILDVLRLLPGAKPGLIESSCCGMAGSFGYEASRHAVSMQMAELSLLPAVRAAPNAIVVADGTSCRHQIEGGTGREAVHVARLLARALPATCRRS